MNTEILLLCAHVALPLGVYVIGFCLTWAGALFLVRKRFPHAHIEDGGELFVYTSLWPVVVPFYLLCLLILVIAEKLSGVMNRTLTEAKDARDGAVPPQGSTPIPHRRRRQ